MKERSVWVCVCVSVWGGWGMMFKVTNVNTSKEWWNSTRRSYFTLQITQFTLCCCRLLQLHTVCIYSDIYSTWILSSWHLHCAQIKLAVNVPLIAPFHMNKTFRFTVLPTLKKHSGCKIQNPQYFKFQAQPVSCFLSFSHPHTQPYPQLYKIWTAINRRHCCTIVRSRGCWDITICKPPAS